jgi:cytochrome c553
VTHRLPIAAALLLALAGPSAAVAGPAPLAAQGCVGCHGPEGRGAGAVPALAGRDAAELQALLNAFRSGDRPATIMTRIVPGYSEEELAAVAAHFAGLR